MKLRELIEELIEIEKEEGKVEVLAVDHETGEEYSPVISVFTENGIRKMRIG